jgi:hypothetical protein
MKVEITECGLRTRVFNRKEGDRGSISLGGRKFYGKVDGKRFVPDHKNKFAQVLKAQKY